MYNCVLSYEAQFLLALPGGQTHLGAVYTMDHEVIRCSSKVCDWPFNLFHDWFGLHQEERRKKKCKSDHGTWGLQKAYCQAYIIIVMVRHDFAMGARSSRSHSIGLHSCNYTKYDTQCHLVSNVTIITLWMTPLMNKWTTIVMLDGHPLA